MIHLFKPTSYRTGTALAIGATSVWKIISFANSLLVAAYFGFSQETDIYFYLLMLIGLGLNFVGTCNATAVQPEAMTLEAQHPGQGCALLNIFFLLTMGISLFCLVLGLLVPDTLLAMCSAWTREQLAPHTMLIRLGFLLFALQLFSATAGTILEMHHRFSTALLFPLNALLPLASLLLFGKNLGIISMMYGFVAAYLIQDILFFKALVQELNWNFLAFRVHISRRLIHNLISLGIQCALNVCCNSLPLYLLSSLGTGWVSALNYAKQLSETPTEILSQRVANLSKIQLTEHVAREDWQQGNDSYLAVNHFLLFLLTPLAVFSCFYAPEIISIFFERGAFTLQDGQMAAGFLRPLLFVMLLTSTGIVQSNIISATRTWKEFLPYSLVGYVLFLVLLPLTMRHWGGFAYPYTLLFCNLIGFLIAFYFLLKQVPAWHGWETLRQLGRILSLNILALVPAAVYGWYVAGHNPWMTVFIGGVIFMTALLGLCYHSGDLQFFIRQCLPNKKF